MKFPKCSLVFPTYNWPEALELLLLSALRQSHMPNEIIIADDGSREDTKILIEKFQNISSVPIHHVWHEDLKNRKPAIMNKAIASSLYEYIVEIDGDIVMHPHFIKDHLSSATPNCYLYGSRAGIDLKFVPSVLKNKQIDFHFLSPEINKKTRLIRWPLLSSLYKKSPVRSRKLRGCNMSFWKSDFVEVNGFNEELTGWGIDDSELAQRFLNNGMFGKRLKFKGIVYHINHIEQDKSHIHINQLIEENTTKNNSTYIKKGVDQYLSD